jgi:glycosyltransferase involved in cell wall biosynthesis
MKIGIATPVLIDGDAVGNDVVNQYLSLRSKYDVHLFAEHSNVPFIVSNIMNIKKVLDKEDDIYIYHHSISCEYGVKNLEDLKCRRIVKYHNITPPYFFEPNSHIAKECQKGLDQLKIILGLKCEIWSDSEFNYEDLRKIDAGAKFTLLPPFNQINSLHKIKPDHQSVLMFNDCNTNIIMIGRVASNKNVLLGVQSFHSYVNHHNANARLLIVGDSSPSPYVNDIKNLIKSLGLEKKVIVTGKVTSQILKAIYLIADVLLVTSNHEGFCVPIVEAMAFRVPVVAAKMAAIPYTTEDAAILIDGPLSSINFSNGIKKALSEKEYYITKGIERFKNNFSHTVIENKLYNLIAN